ncbi:MAG: hypothetical protein C0467_25290 [Planctomycetaceae bacterium]|nr:hypothetical protein [Planctomycetaceae bacterium]
MSVAGAIADAIVTKINSLAIPSATVVKLKKPSLVMGDEPIKIVVSVGDSSAIEALTASKDLVTRPVAVTLFRAGGKVTGDDDADRTILEAIRVAVNARGTFSGVPQFNQIDVAREAAFDGAALKADINQGVELFSVQTIEARD